jgi:hypothetical protein
MSYMRFGFDIKLSPFAMVLDLANASATSSRVNATTPSRTCSECDRTHSPTCLIA